MSRQSTLRTFTFGAVGAAAVPTLLLMTASAAQAQPAAAAAAVPPAKPWQNKITAGLTLTRGNSDSLSAAVAGESRRKWEHDELFLQAAFGYGETKNDVTVTDPVTGTTTTERVKVKSEDYVTAGAQYNHLFTPKLYAGLKLDFRHDDIADLDYRFTVSPLVGYYFIKTETDLFNGEAGPSWIYERQGGEDDNYFTARLAEKYEHKFSDKARVWESVEYLPQIDDWAGNYLINAEAGVETLLTKGLSLRLVAQDTYDSQPAPGRKENDFRIIAGIAYSFGL